MKKLAKVLAAAAAISGFVMPFADAQTADDTITIAMPFDARSVNPGVNRSGTTDGYVLNIFEGLVAYRNDMTVAPLLAKSFDISADKRTYTFHLRRGVRFHNGKVMTSADVMWNWKRYMDPKTAWRCTADFDGRISIKVVSVSAPDPDTFVMTLGKPNGLFLADLARTDCGDTAILSPDSVDASGNFIKPIGTGPFMLAEWKRNEYMLLRRFDQYVSAPGDKPDGYVGSKRPLAEFVKLLIVPDPAAVVAGLRSGRIDAAQLEPGDYDNLKTNPDLAINVVPTASRAILMFQTLDPLLSNVKLRLAMTLALDQKALVEAASDGLGTVTNSSVLRGSPWFSDVQKENYPYDPEQAKRLAQEAGYHGQPLVMYANNHGTSNRLGIVAQSMWQAAGFNVQIQLAENASQLDHYNSGKYQLLSQIASGQFDPALAYDQFMGPKATQPRKQWDNPEAQALLERAMISDDKGERQVLFDRLHRMQLADDPMLILFNLPDINAHTKRVDGAFFWQSMVRAWEARVIK